MPTLTYKDKEFILNVDHCENSKIANTDKLILKNQTRERSIYATTDIKVAAIYKRFADLSAKKILRRAFIEEYERPTSPLPSFLDAHQKDGINWVLTRSRCYIAHAPGAGKTCVAILAADYTNEPGHAVFIVPPSLTKNWEREIYKFSWAKEDAHVSILSTTHLKDEMDWNANYIIVPDSMLTKSWVLEKLIHIKKKFVAVDEASRFKEHSSQRTIALFGGQVKNGLKSPGLVFDSKHVALLDGSPMPNRPMELWAPTFAMCPEAIDFMQFEQFGFRYCGARIGDFGRWEFKGSSNEEDLRRRLREKFMHVVPESVLKHSERMRSILYLNKDVRSRAHKKWESKTHFNLDNLSEDLSDGHLATFRRELGIRKIPLIAQYVTERLEAKNESILLFAWHREVCVGLQKALSKFNADLIMGGTLDHARELYIDRFQKGKTRILILNIAAGGRGHNLQKADRVVFGEYSWTDENNIQCEKRASRKGRDENLPVRCDYLVSPNSMDEMILNAIFRKQKSVKEIMG